MKTKVLILSECMKCLYPKGTETLEDFMDQLEKTERTFIEMYKLDDDKTIDPYYVEEDITKIFINFDSVESVSEGEVEILKAEQFDRVLSKLAKICCSDCENDGESETGCDSLPGKRDKIDLETKSCWLKEECFDEDPDPDPDPDKKIVFINKGRNNNN